jgi:hypothetical protein
MLRYFLTGVDHFEELKKKGCPSHLKGPTIVAFSLVGLDAIEGHLRLQLLDGSIFN